MKLSREGVWAGANGYAQRVMCRSRVRGVDRGPCPQETTRQKGRTGAILGGVGRAGRLLVGHTSPTASPTVISGSCESRSVHASFRVTIARSEIDSQLNSAVTDKGDEPIRTGRQQCELVARKCSRPGEKTKRPCAFFEQRKTSFLGARQQDMHGMVRPRKRQAGRQDIAGKRVVTSGQHRRTEGSMSRSKRGEARSNCPGTDIQARAFANVPKCDSGAWQRRPRARHAVKAEGEGAWGHLVVDSRRLRRVAGGR